MEKKLKRPPNPPSPGPTGSADLGELRGEMLVLEYKLWKRVRSLREEADAVESIAENVAALDKRFFQPNDKCSHGAENPKA